MMSITLTPGLQYFNFAGAELALDYQCATAQPTHLLVLVNGYQRTRLDFRAFRKKLEKQAPHVATVALDNRYCGETRTSSELSMDIMAQDVSAIADVFMNKLNLNIFSVLGISMGGMIAQTLAVNSQPIQFPLSSCTRREERRVQEREAVHQRHRNDVQELNGNCIIENLFLVSTTCGGVGRTWSPNIKDPSTLKYENTNVDLESTKKNMSRYFADKFLKNSPLLFEMMCKSMLHGNKLNHEVNANHQFDVSVHYDGAALLNKISAQKTIIFSGEEDRIIPYANALYLNKHIKQSQLITYSNVGHLILIEEPEQFVQDVASFF